MPKITMRLAFVVCICAVSLAGCEQLASSKYIVDRESLTHEQTQRRDALIDELNESSDASGIEDLLMGRRDSEIRELLSLAHQIRIQEDGRTRHIFHLGTSGGEGDSTLTVIVKNGYVDEVRNEIIVR